MYMYLPSITCDYMYGMRRTETIQITLTPEEKALVKSRAGRQPVASYVREKLYLGTPTGESAGTPGGEANEPEQARVSMTYEQRVRQLRAQGMTTPLAKKQAAQEI